MGDLVYKQLCTYRSALWIGSQPIWQTLHDADHGTASSASVYRAGKHYRYGGGSVSVIRPRAKHIVPFPVTASKCYL